MPPRVVNTNQVGGFGAFVEGIPPITRAFAGAMFACAAAVYVRAVNPYSLALSWPLILRKFQLWRLITAHAFVPFSVTFVFLMVFLLKYGAEVESEVYRFAPADFLFMLMLGAAFLSSVPALLGLPLMFTTAPLITMVIYVWSRNYPERPVSLYGLVTIQAFYLPFAFLAITVIMGGSPLMDLFGIAAGHLWYFFTDLYPRSSGRRLLTTPRILSRWLSDLGVGAPPPPSEQQQRSAFRGRGQRLGSS